MSILLIAGFIIVFVKLADNETQRKLKSQFTNTTSASIPVPVSDVTVANGSSQINNASLSGVILSVSIMEKSERILFVQPCGTNICFVTEGHPRGYKMIVMQPHLPEEMMIQKTIFLQK